jgi:hypothetical protein
MKAPAEDPSPKKLSLHLRSVSDDAVRQMAQNTIRPLLDEEARDEAEMRKWDNAPVGTAMPDGSIYAGRTTAGVPVYAMPEDEEKGRLMDLAHAQESAHQLKLSKAHGHDDWRLPAREELTLLFNNRAQIGNFFTKAIGWPCGAYWSAPDAGTGEIFGRYFPKGNEESVADFCGLTVRCVRSGPWRPD